MTWVQLRRFNNAPIYRTPIWVNLDRVHSLDREKDGSTAVWWPNVTIYVQETPEEILEIPAVPPPPQ